MDTDSVLTYGTIFGFLLTLTRISAVFAFLPLAAFRGAADAAKILFALAFTFLLRDEWAAPAGMENSFGRMIAAVATEMVLGLAIGMALAVALEAFQFAAQCVSLAAGLGYASTVDPSSGADSTVLLTIAELVAGLLFFTLGADRLLVRVLADSLRICPPEAFTPHREWGSALALFAGSIFSAGLRLAAPVIGFILLADFSLAVLGRMQSQLHLMTLTMPVKLGATMILMALTLGMQQRILTARVTEWIRFAEGLLRSH